MNREELEKAKRDLLSLLHHALWTAAEAHGVATKNVKEVVEGYGINMVEDFFWEALCEIHEAEEKQARKDERELRRQGPVVL